MTKRASCAAVAESIHYSVRKMVDGSRSPSSVISMALLHESASILRRFEALPIAIRQPRRSSEPQIFHISRRRWPHSIRWPVIACTGRSLDQVLRLVEIIARVRVLLSNRISFRLGITPTTGRDICGGGPTRLLEAEIVAVILTWRTNPVYRPCTPV
jgi:hypothetical protein